MIVVDTNILAYLWLPSPRNVDAQALLLLDRDWAAPLLWRSEFRNVTIGYLRAGLITQHEAQQAIAEAAASLLAGEHTVSDDFVLSLAVGSKCSAYDCEYIALAQAQNTILVTEDKALLRAFPRHCKTMAQMI